MQCSFLAYYQILGVVRKRRYELAPLLGRSMGDSEKKLES